MKKLVTLSLLLIGFTSYAQKSPSFRLNAYGNYVFDDNVDSYYSTTNYFDGKVKGGFQWGVGLEYMVQPTLGAEISYLRQDTKGPTTYYDPFAVLDPVKSAEFDLAINYIFFGTTRYFPVSPKVEPFIGAQVGVGIIDVANPTNGNGSNNTKFAWGIKGGTHVWVSESVGIKLQAALQSVSQAVGGGLYFGTGGVGTGVSSYSSMLQFSLGSGLVFKLGGK